MRGREEREGGRREREREGGKERERGRRQDILMHNLHSIFLMHF